MHEGPSTQPLFPYLHARTQALSIWHDVLGAAEAEGNKVEALEVLSKILGQYKAAEEEESVREGATQEDKAHAVAQVEQLLLKVIDMDLPGTASYHDQYIQRLQKKLAASTDAQQSEQVRTNIIVRGEVERLLCVSLVLTLCLLTTMQLRQEIIRRCKHAVQFQPTSPLSFEFLLEIAEEDDSGTTRPCRPF